MRFLSRFFLTLALLILSLPLSAAATAGNGFILLSRGAWAPIDGGAVTPLGLEAREVQSAFDGEHFLVVWRSGSEVRAELLAPGAVDPLSVITLSTTATRDPLVAWDGTRYLVFWTDTLARGAVVSPQGIMERSLSFVLPSVDAVAAGPNGVVLLSLYRTDTAEVLDAAILGADLRLGTRTRIGSIPRSTGFGTTYLANPAITSFGTGWYATWLTARAGRSWAVVGTRVSAEGQALDLEPYPFEGNTVAGHVLLANYASSPADATPLSFRDGAAVIATSFYSPALLFLIGASGAVMPAVMLRDSGTLGDLAQREDGTVLAVYFPDPETAVVSPLLRTSAPLLKRRPTRH